jgi:hypothetical protein
MVLLGTFKQRIEPGTTNNGNFCKDDHTADPNGRRPSQAIVRGMSQWRVANNPCPDSGGTVQTLRWCSGLYGVSG